MIPTQRKIPTNRQTATHAGYMRYRLTSHGFLGGPEGHCSPRNDAPLAPPAFFRTRIAKSACPPPSG
eukprot:9411758-Pyramimonas_sp.AAC.1